MPKFSASSLKRLESCHDDLRVIFGVVIESFDCSVLEGRRGRDAQNAAYASGKSQLKYPQSKHNENPSMAIDVAPYPIDWEDLARFRFFAGHVMGIASYLLRTGDIGHRLRWGGDWDMDTQVSDNGLNDLVHFELVAPEHP